MTITQSRIHSEQLLKVIGSYDPPNQLTACWLAGMYATCFFPAVASVDIMNSMHCTGFAHDLRQDIPVSLRDGASILRGSMSCHHLSLSS